MFGSSGIWDIFYLYVSENFQNVSIVVKRMAKELQRPNATECHYYVCILKFFRKNMFSK